MATTATPGTEIQENTMDQKALDELEMAQAGINQGRWTREEHELFLKGLQAHGKEWKKIAELIKTRTVVQIRTHAQKYFQKLAKSTGQPVMSTSKKGDIVRPPARKARKTLDHPFTPEGEYDRDEAGHNKNIQRQTFMGPYNGVLPVGSIGAMTQGGYNHSVGKPGDHGTGKGQNIDNLNRSGSRMPGNGGVLVEGANSGSLDNGFAHPDLAALNKRGKKPNKIRVPSFQRTADHQQVADKALGKLRIDGKKNRVDEGGATPRTVAAATILLRPKIHDKLLSGGDTPKTRQQATWLVSQEEHANQILGKRRRTPTGATMSSNDATMTWGAAK
mmetsp:Transcript_21907/g.41062  ORF Transcript_21907/g.41062 Transcript_21907/m.41062 type:complete len:332 (+) Transcript_21907:662-1657(+)